MVRPPSTASACRAYITKMVVNPLWRGGSSRIERVITDIVNEFDLGGGDGRQRSWCRGRGDPLGWQLFPLHTSHVHPLRLFSTIPSLTPSLTIPTLPVFCLYISTWITQVPQTAAPEGPVPDGTRAAPSPAPYGTLAASRPGPDSNSTIADSTIAANPSTANDLDMTEATRMVLQTAMTTDPSRNIHIQIGEVGTVEGNYNMNPDMRRIIADNETKATLARIETNQHSMAAALVAAGVAPLFTFTDTDGRE